MIESIEEVIVRPSDLPLCCPPSDAPVWNLHPRVYMPLEETGREECPYCSTVYVLAEAPSRE